MRCSCFKQGSLVPMHAHAASHGRALARAAALTRSCSGARHCCTTHPPGKCVAHATAGALTGKEVLLPWGMPCNTALRARVQAGCCQRKRGGAILASRRTVRAPAPQQGCAGGARVEAIAGWVALGRRRRVPGSSGRLQRGGGGWPAAHRGPIGYEIASCARNNDTLGGRAARCNKKSP